VTATETTASLTAVRAVPGFRGWWMLVWCTLALGLTAPGQTVGVSVFIDHFIGGLGLSRSAVSGAYLVGTITGAFALPSIGRWVDRTGISRAMLVIGAAFGAALIATGAVQGIVTLALAFVGIRMLGQGALSLTGQTGIALWFNRRRGLAIGLSMTMSAGMMALAPILLTGVIDAVGWRAAWVVAGVAIWATVIPIALFAIVDRPADIGQQPDGGSRPAADIANQIRASLTAHAAIRTPSFWAVAAISALSASLGTGLMFHQFSILTAQGLSRIEAAAVFLPQVLGTVAAGFLFGWLSDRVSARVLLPIAGCTLAAALLLATVVSPGPVALLYGLVLGMGMGQIRAIGAATYPRWFGTAHIASIMGIAASIVVGASATGPLLLSVGNDAFGSYAPVLLLGAAITIAVAVLAALVKPPCATS
jgi:MFS family permease